MNIKKLFTKPASAKAMAWRRRIIWGIVAIVVVLGAYFLFFNKKTTQQTLTVHPADFLQQVSVSGKVMATQNLDLSFEQAGIVRAVTVKEGDQVFAGKFIASQDIAQLSAQLSQMRAGIDLQKAKLAQLLAGASHEDVKIAEDKVASADQDLKNADQSTLVTLNTSYNAIYNAYTVALYMQNTYFTSADAAGINVQNAKNDISHDLQDAKNNLGDANNGLQGAPDTQISRVLSDLNNTYAGLKVIREQCDIDVYYSRVTATDKASLDTQKTNINTALTNLTASQTSIASYKTALQQAQNNLDSVKAPARDTDIAVYQAQISQAEAQAQDVQAQIRKREIFAPIDGTITTVNAKVGSISSVTEPAASMISAGKFQIESYVPEIYVALVKIGNDADVTLDAYGADKIFNAEVVSIDPSETIKDGVSTYKLKLELNDNGVDVRNGMTANVVITTEKKSNVIAVPQGIITGDASGKFVPVKNGDKIEQRAVVVGEISSSGQAEIVSGLKDGDVVIIK